MTASAQYEHLREMMRAQDCDRPAAEQQRGFAARGATMNVLRSCLLITALGVGIMTSPQASPVPQLTRSGKGLTNPLLPVGPDPWVEYKDGFYYYMNTTINNLTLWKTHSMADIGAASKKIVWTPPAAGPYSHDIWAPEIHFLEGKWYIYFAADAGDNQTHPIFVLENSSSDPFQGPMAVERENF
jgi:hypothetical protein